MASGRRKVVKLGACWPVPRGACGAGGAPAPGSGPTTPLPGAGVRKHPAPEGALRLSRNIFSSPFYPRQKAPSTRRCIKTLALCLRHDLLPRQKAPSTTRCIKTPPPGSIRRSATVRKHLAPEGALRRKNMTPPFPRVHARKHPAPQGTLRLHPETCRDASQVSQKAPNTTRCIKTVSVFSSMALCIGQKAPSTRRCIKTLASRRLISSRTWQKARSTRRCIKTL